MIPSHSCFSLWKFEKGAELSHTIASLFISPLIACLDDLGFFFGGEAVVA